MIFGHATTKEKRGIKPQIGHIITFKYKKFSDLIEYDTDSDMDIDVDSDIAMDCVTDNDIVDEVDLPRRP